MKTYLDYGLTQEQIADALFEAFNVIVGAHRADPSSDPEKAIDELTTVLLVMDRIWQAMQDAHPEFNAEQMEWMTRRVMRKGTDQELVDLGKRVDAWSNREGGLVDQARQDGWGKCEFCGGDLVPTLPVMCGSCGRSVDGSRY